MENYDPLETLEQLRAWVEKSFPSLKDGTVRMTAAKKRHRTVMGIIDQLDRLQIPISEDIVSERESLEELIAASNEREVLTFLAKELSSLAKDINRQLRGERSSTTNRGGRGPAKKLWVSFSDGTVICENKAIDTFVKSVQYMGFSRIAKLQTIRASGHPIVSLTPNELSRGFRELDGYFVETHMSTKNKARYIQRIADALRIDVSVDVLDR